MGKIADYLQNLINMENDAARQQAETQLALDKQRQQNTKKALDTIKGLAVSNTERQIAQTTAQVQAQQQTQEAAKTALRKYLDRVEGAAVANTQRQVQQDQARIQGQQEVETALQKYITRVTEKPTDELSAAAREERAARRAMNAENAAAGAMAQAGVRPSEEDIARRLQSEEAYRKAGERLEKAGGTANTSMTIGNLAQYGSSLANYLVGEGKQLGISARQQELREAQRALLAMGDTETAAKYEEDIQALEAIRNERGTVQQALDRGTAWGQEQMAAAKVGRSEAGKFLVDLALQGEQMAVDAALGGAVGARLLPMYMRAAGGAEQSAYAELKEQENPDARATLRYGRAVGAVEALTEKMYDGVSGLFGKGAADKAVEDFINRVAGDKLGRAALQTFFNFAGEAGEELVSGLIDPALQSIYNGKSIGESWSTLEVSELLYDAFVGGVMGLLGGSAEVLGNFNAPRGEQADTRTTSEKVRDTLKDPQALMEYIAKYGKLGDTKTEAGRRLSQLIGQEEARAKELRELDMELKSGKKGSLKDETPNGIKKRNLNAQQKVGLRVARTLAEMGNNIHIFQSEQVDGAWVLPENLRAKMGRDGAPNGWYDTETGDIWVDLNAGKDGKGTMAYTLAHEITHKIKASSEVSFGALQDFLNGIYGIEGVSVEELAAERVAEAAAKGKALSMDNAMEEVVADSMEAMFTDARVMDKIDALKARNQSLWKTLRDNVRRWARQFDTAYVPTDPDSVEGRYIKAMRDYVDELAEIFAEGTVKAGIGKEKAPATEDGATTFFAERPAKTIAESIGGKRQKGKLVDKLKKNIQEISNYEPVAYITGEEFKKGKVDLVTQVVEYFGSFNFEVEREGFGKVSIDKSGVQSDISHGLGRAKSATFMAVPEVIKKGKQIDFMEEVEDGIDSYVFAAPVMLGENKSVVGVIVKARKKNGKNWFYVHEVVDENGDIIYAKKEAPIIKNRLASEDTYGGDRSLNNVSVTLTQNDVKPDLSLPTGKEGKSGTKKDFPGLPTGKERVRNSERAVSDWVATMQEARQKLNGGNKYSFTTDNGNEFVIRALPQLDGTVTASITKNGEMLISGSYGSRNEAISVLIGEAQQNDGRKLNGMEATWADAGEDPDQLIGTPGGMERAGDRVYSKAEEKPASEKLIEFEDGTAIPENSFGAAIREAFPNRIDRAQAQEIAEKGNYPRLQRLDGKEPQQVIPYYTFVKAMDRGNYGLITSWDPYQGFGVQFINKADGIAGFRYFPANELRAVDARYSDPDGNWWKVEDPGEPVRAESADMAAEKAANVETLKEFTPGGEEEMGFERPNAKDKNRLYDPDFQINTENDSESMTEKRKQAAEAEYRTLTTTRSRTQSEIKVLEGLEKIAGTQLTEAQREHLDDLRETLQAYTDELKTRKAPVQEETSVKTMPTEAARSAANKLLKMMEIQAGTRAEGRAILDDMFRRFVETGKLTETDIETAFYALLEKGISVQEEQSYSGMLYRELKGTKIYVSEKTKADFTDYADFRKQAMAAGLTLTNDTNAYSIDQLTAELTDTWGDMFEIDSAPGDQLRNLVDMMEQGKTRHIPKLEAVAQEAAEAHIDVEEAIEDYLSEFRTAAKQFAEAAKIEIAAKDKAAKAMAEQRAYLEKAEEKRKQRNRERELQNRVMAQMKKLSRMGKKTSNAQKAAIAELIGDIDLMAKSISKTGIESLEALQRDYEQRKAEAGWVDENSPGNWLGDNYSEQKLARLGKKHVKEMSVSELLELGNAVSHMITQIENQNKLVDDERHRQISETAKQMRSELAGARGIEQNRASTKLKEFLSFEQLGGRRVFDMLGGWKDGAWHDLGLALEKGGVDQLAFTKAAFDEVKPWMEANQSWLKTASGKNAKWIEYTVPAILGAAEDGTPITGEVTFEITPMMRAELLLHSKNTDNLRHIAEGGIVIPDKRAYIKGNKDGMYSGHRKVRLSPEIVRMIANSASPQEVSFAEVMQRFMDGTSKDAINSVSMLLDGFERAGVGAYWPLNTDKTFNKSDAGREAMAGTVEGIGSIANERVRGANTPIILQDAYETFVNSVNNTSRYYGYAIPVRNFNALWNYTFRMTGDPQSDSIKALLDQKWGTEANRYLKKIVDDVQGANGRKNDMTGRVLNRLRSGMAGATLMFNPSVAFSQAASYPGAGATLSTAALLHGLNPATKVDPQLIQKYTPVYWSRGDQSADTTMLEGEGYKRDLGQKAPALFGWIQGMDQLTIRRLWAACDYEVSHKADTRELTGDAHYEAVAALFNKAVHDTQPNYTTFERSQLLRSDNELTRTLTMFKTVSQQYYGVMFEAQARLSQARSEYKAAQARGDADAVSEAEGRLKTAKKDWARGMSSIFGANAMYVVIKALFRAVKGTDKDYRDENGEYTWQTIAAGLGKDLAEVTAGSVMLGDELYSYAEKMINGGKWEPPEISALGTLADFANALGSLAQIGKYGAQDAAGRIREAAMTLATAMGVPAKNMESWTLAFAKFVSPEATTAYENFFDEKTKTDVQKLSGRRLEIGVKTVLQNRFGSEVSAEEITRLVAAGYADALPKAIPADFEWSSTDEKGNTTKHEVELTYSVRERYREAWTEYANLNALLNSRGYQKADDETKAAMIKGLYDYATAQAKAAVSEYALSGTNEKINAAAEAGVSTSDYLAFYYGTKDIEGDKDESGKTISGSENYKKIQTVKDMRLSAKSEDYLMRSFATDSCKDSYAQVQKYMSFSQWAEIYCVYNMTDAKDESGKTVSGLKKEKMNRYLTEQGLSANAIKAVMGVWYTNYSLPTGKEKGAGDTLRAYMGLPTGKEEKKKSAGETLREYMGLPTGKEKNASEFLKNYIRDNA